MSEFHSQFVFIPREVLAKAMKMGLKREVKFALAAWSFAPANNQNRSVKRNQVLKMAGMHLGEGEYQATLKACYQEGLLPERLEIL